MSFETFAVPLSVLLIPYGLFMLIFFLYSIFNVYHLMRFGIYGHSLYIIVILFLMGSVVLSGISAFGLLQYDWSINLSAATILGNEMPSL